MMSKNDLAWESLFNEQNILDKINRNGLYEISANLINQKREARLMTKFDHAIQLPQIFKHNNLTILPNSRGTYLIGRFKSYENLPHNSSITIEEIPFPSYIQTINTENIYSESAALLCAYNAGIINDLLEEETSLTVFGRMSTGKFSYFIENNQNEINYKINVDNSQCEIDSGFEGSNIFAIIEAKNQFVEDFLVRQLYYPYRLWTNKITKKVIPIFLFYSDNVFSFYIFRFTDDNHYNSIEFVKQKKYQIGVNDIELADITAILSRIKLSPYIERRPFPQADNFARVIDLVLQIYTVNIPLSQEDITTNYAFDIRQTQYYTNAAIYLGLIEKRLNHYSITEKGSNIVKRTSKSRHLALVECILSKRVFNQTLQLYFQQLTKPTREQVIEIMRNANVNLSGATIPRRAQTVLAWIDWILGLSRYSGY